MRNNLILGFM